MLFLDALYRDGAGKAGITYVDVWDGANWSAYSQLSATTTVTPPHLLSRSQTDARESTNLSLTFDTAVSGGSGYISIYDSTHGRMVEQIPATSSEIYYSADHKTVTINPRLMLTISPSPRLSGSA